MLLLINNSNHLRVYLDRCLTALQLEHIVTSSLRNHQALADGDKIYGVVTTASNSDGKSTTPITAPSSDMQARLIEQTLLKAGLSGEMIQYVEMHGMTSFASHV